MKDAVEQFIQYALVIPLGYIWHRVVQLGKDLDSHRSASYSKEEVDKMIALNNKTLQVQLDAIQKDIMHIRYLLEGKPRNWED